MAKASSPIRLQQDLTAKRFHRSTAKQIEYWDELGWSVVSTLAPDILLSVSTDLACSHVEPVVADPADPEDVSRDLETQR